MEATKESSRFSYLASPGRGQDQFSCSTAFASTQEFLVMPIRSVEPFFPHLFFLLCEPAAYSAAAR